ncbi:MAG: vanadium-dependent haloperoxidase [Chloroflexi bacterium]|nr:vanadium-dependent haloperoxidase [Chloroflexota bacterium]
MAQPRQRSRSRAWLATLVALALLGATAVVPVASVTAAEPTDMVLEWNANAVSVIGSAAAATPPGLGQPPPLAPIHLAMVQGAIYDAVNSITRTHQPYLGWIAAPTGASQAAAVATAAHHVLYGLVPGTDPTHPVKVRLDELYAVSLGKITDGQAESDGVAVGAAAAAAMLANRSTDGRTNNTRTFPIGTQPGEWRPVSPPGTNVFSWIGEVRPFSLDHQSQLRVPAPPALTSDEYTADFNEVKAIGGQAAGSRTEAQQLLATFSVQNPFPFANRAFREIATAKNLSTAQQARLFAMTSFSTADALISCWNNKHFYNSWRPQTAIRLAADDGNPATIADPAWTSQFPNPGYPDNPSGYNCFAAGMMSAGRAYFGTDFVSFTLKPPAPAVDRSYTRFTDYIRDAIDGRILTGFHFRHADVNGAWLGKKAAQWVAKHEFQPLP